MVVSGKHQMQNPCEPASKPANTAAALLTQRCPSEFWRTPPVALSSLRIQAEHKCLVVLHAIESADIA